MAPTDLEQALKDLPRIGRLIDDRPDRQVWRFELGGRAYDLTFYPAGGWREWVRRRLHGSPALGEFYRLQWLQRAGVVAPRAVGAMMGFAINGRRGDAVVIETLEPADRLDEYLNQCQLQARPVPQRRDLLRQFLELLEKLGRAGLGHSELHLGSFLLHEGKLYLLRADAVHKEGLHMRDIERLALSCAPYASRADLVRAWKQLGPGGDMPPQNAQRLKAWKEARRRIYQENEHFGQLTVGPWRGHFFKRAASPQRYAPASRLELRPDHWAEAFPLLLQQIQSDQLEVIKRSNSGDVLAGEIVLGGRPLSVIVKRPWRKYYYRYAGDIIQGTRARRAWDKAWQLICRNIPTAWPLIMMEKRLAGYVTDALIVFEQVPGHTLATYAAADPDPQAYSLLLHRCGRLLRKLEEGGLYLYDAKATNWMVRQDPRLGPTPLLIDMDGLHARPRRGGGLTRLLRSLRDDPAARFATPEAMALLRGYAPFANDQHLAQIAGLEKSTASIHPLKAGPEVSG